MSTAATETRSMLPLLFQYTIEAYKTFEKLAEILPNPLASAVFQSMAKEERRHRDLIEIRYGARPDRIPVTLSGDLRFQDILEGDLRNREIAEWLVSRERAMEKKLRDAIESAPEEETSLLQYVAGAKRAHAIVLEREVELTKRYADWFDREDAESLIAHGESA